jgi:hypothetical protein
VVLCSPKSVTLSSGGILEGAHNVGGAAPDQGRKEAGEHQRGVGLVLLLMGPLHRTETKQNTKSHKKIRKRSKNK